ncbi:hypothetical protein J2Z31_000858 [Sinorhizobium kostiense]|uniref:Transposase n=1 Tax=Sinorhizobium kostiense TaxID=76747 RepID=A0ABS4QUN8_9HYPH|nr:hypothetical protein [Sinorhizobium kostiense]
MQRAGGGDGPLDHLLGVRRQYRCNKGGHDKLQLLKGSADASRRQITMFQSAQAVLAFIWLRAATSASAASLDDAGF